MNPCILMRTSFTEENEFEIASKYFKVYRYRSEIPADSLVIGRYANLPFHAELEHDVNNLKSKLINSTSEHNYVANFEYYYDIEKYTFKTWFRAEDIPFKYRDSAFVVKGTTNSRKHEWSRLMFAPNFLEANKIAAELRCDGLIAQQGIVFRQYVPLETFEVSEVSGIPFSNEWRIFYYKGKRLAHGYYWSNIDCWDKVNNAKADFETNGLAFADKVAQEIKDNVPFVVIDVAKTTEGNWIVVELNDGCQAGLNDSVSADELYKNLKLAISSMV